MISTDFNQVHHRNTLQTVFLQVFEVLPGTFHLDSLGLYEGQIIPAGSVVGFNDANRTASVICCGLQKTNTASLGLVYEDTTVKPGAKIIIVSRAFVDKSKVPACTADLQAFLHKIVFL
ncbi:MAG TPA: hypothetical protein VGN63_19605 [Flavisolibacter sp.]|jgi:hypothetical protein|nr:hypothetical protein [Flavisolibacter sp.]